MNAHRPAIAVFDRHLALAIRTQVGKGAVLAHLRQTFHQPVSQLDRHRHELWSLCAGIPKHHALIARAHRLDLCVRHLPLPRLCGLVNAKSDVRRLLLDGGDHPAGGTVKASFGAIIADLADRLTHDLGDLDIALGGDLTRTEHQASGHGRLTGDPCIGILHQDRIQDRIRDQVTHLVGVPLGNGLGGKQELRRVHKVVHRSISFCQRVGDVE